MHCTFGVTRQCWVVRFRCSLKYRKWYLLYTWTSCCLFEAGMIVISKATQHHIIQQMHPYKWMNPVFAMVPSFFLTNLPTSEPSPSSLIFKTTHNTDKANQTTRLFHPAIIVTMSNGHHHIRGTNNMHRKNHQLALPPCDDDLSLTRSNPLQIQPPQCVAILY